MTKYINIFTKSNHWLIAILTIILGITGAIAAGIYDYDVLIPNLEYAYGVNEIASGKASQVFIAKLVRLMLFEYHYQIGIAFATLVCIGFFLRMYRGGYRFMKNPAPFVFLFLTLILLITGILRFYRGEIEFLSEAHKYVRNVPRHIHHYTAWILLLASIFHIAHMISINAKKINTLISDMFTSKSLHLGFLAVITTSLIISATTLSPLYAEEVKDLPLLIVSKPPTRIKEDKNYKEAMEYYSGKKGFVHEKRTFPNCPYDACEKSTDVVQSFEENGERYYNIKIHDFKSAKALFDKSIVETKNPLSAERNIIMVMERLNYKSKHYEEYLLDHVKTSLGIDGTEAIKKEVQKNMAYIDTSNSQMMLYKAAEVYENGYFGIEKDIEKAKLFYQSVISKNDIKNMYFMLAKNKLSILSKKD